MLFSFFPFLCFAQQTIGRVERLDPTLDQLIDPNANVEILAEGFNWSEGARMVPQLDAVLFTDVPENKLYQWSEKDGLQYLS